MPVAAVILAAGASSRLGEPKQLVLLAGERLLERAARVAAEAGCEPVVVVLGSQAHAIQAGCALSHAIVVVNDAWAEGMASSIRCGVAQVASCEAVIVMTCDQPAVTAAHLRSLIALGANEPVASSYSGRHGVPAYFPLRYLSALGELQGDAGARSLLESASAVELAGGDLDIDTPEALTAAQKIFET